MTLIDQIRADRMHSSRNPNVDEWRIVVDGPSPGWVQIVGPAFKIGAPTTVTDLNGQDYTDRHKDARRIARVPELEDAYEAVLEENDRLRRERDHYQRVSQTYAKRIDTLHVAIRPFAEVLAVFSFAEHQLILLSEDNPKGRRLAHLLPDQFDAARASLAETGGKTSE